MTNGFYEQNRIKRAYSRILRQKRNKYPFVSEFSLTNGQTAIYHYSKELGGVGWGFTIWL